MLKAGFGPKEGLISRVGRLFSPIRGRPLLAPPCAAGAAGNALCARVCLVALVVVRALRRPGAFAGGGSLERDATASVSDFVEPVEAEETGLEAAGLFDSTRVDNGLELRVVLAA